MHLITHDIIHLGELVLSTFCQSHGVHPAKIFDISDMLATLPSHTHNDYSQAIDFGAAAWIAERSQTFLFDADQVLQFLRSIDRRLSPGDYHAPFKHMAFQFSRGIEERLFTTGLKPEGSIEENDTITAILLSIPDPDENPRWTFINIVAYYASTSLNRVQLPLHGDGTIEYKPINGDGGEVRRQDKQRLANLAMLLLAYIDTPGMQIEHVQTPERVNRKRERDGKRVLPDYYVCRWNAPKRTTGGTIATGTGSHHSFRYDVAGHFRRLPDGKTIWIRAHQRGLEHETYKPKVYRVD